MSSRIPPDLFSGLGKATRRGVRTCPKCATVNGTRGHSCKNRSCDFVFRSANKTDEGSSSSSSITATKDSRKDEESRIDCCRLLTDSGPGRRLFSVKSPDDPDTKRGFVVLCDSDDSLNTLLLSGSDNRSRCFVRDCTGGECVHVRACARAVAENLAQPLRVKSSALNQMSISPEWKHELWLLARRPGPLVQRVSPQAMVAKDDQDPLGQVHLTFNCDENYWGSKPRVWCQCGRTSNESNKRFCIHFYACLAVFASDLRLSEEFALFLANDNEEETIHIMGDSTEESDEFNRMLAIKNVDEGIQVQILDEEDKEVNFSQILDATNLLASSAEISAMTAAIEDNATLAAAAAAAAAAAETSVNVGSAKKRRNSNSKKTQPPPPPLLERSEPIDEERTSHGFSQWLSSVTERINASMDFNGSGEPESLVFYCPSQFFDCLRERMTSVTTRKRRLPDSAERLQTSAQGHPLTKYTFRLTNVLLAKRVFDTPLVPLQLTRRFAQKPDGTFVHISEDNNRPDDDLRTFLKVGQMSALKNSRCFPLTIEWIPRVYPISDTGELRVAIIYGHQRNGKEESRSK